MDTPDLNNPELYTNRQLSLLEFNRRVVAQAADPDTPLLERLKFLCIASSNLDEFFEIRVSGLRQAQEMGVGQSGPDNRTPQQVLREISDRTHALVDEQYRLLNDEVTPALAESGIRFLRRTEWTPAQQAWIQNYFQTELLPILSPLGLDPAHPFPQVLNKSLNFIVALEGRDAFGRNSGMAVVQAPRALPRVIQLPATLEGNGPYDFAFLSSIIHAHVNDLFPGMNATGCYQFRVTRNSDLYVDEEEIDDLLRAMEGELPSRRYGDAVRLEVAANCPEHMSQFLLEEFELDADALYQVNGPVNLNRLLAVCDLVDRPDLKYPGFTPGLPTELPHGTDLMKVMRRRDILLHHPFESFAPVAELLRQASQDPEVLAIKQTLYRTGADSAIVDHLVTAAQAGKEVTVVVELRARFDEAENIGLANRLQEAGAHVVYGVVGHKTHAKMMMIVRRESGKLRHYVHLGTGNYHSRTARLYTDYGLLTANPAIGEDVHRVFLQLTSLGKVSRLTHLLESPFTLHQGMLDKIAREQAHAEAGHPARIIIKVNSLVEPRVIRALYSASMAGVQIHLIVRGMCSLRPGIEGISDNIEVRSIIGRFLEHTRVFYFANHGEPELFCSSADWMERNFFRRVETGFPLLNPEFRQRVIDDLEAYLQDNTQAWLLGSDGHYTRDAPGPDEAAYSAQTTLLETYAERN
ncbi:polyphosphate kinase [Spiribacter salinus M19-40]|jgi:polyphosphate kinase|uniref:Polyphosphate kinase n=1 Tax=Spiribacter salinus M19-40 TaxID=1260251 RepID=R4VGE8_9GAMM|nr:polyphosphate kinase 1 [Spiribacter salinus]AGM41271.1 polyphosphate kinase [Spiribacter salinus M19-40]MBY5268862.1 RNA degradosome polyphosphate kinase [Spiribacter salinus]